MNGNKYTVVSIRMPHSAPETWEERNRRLTQFIPERLPGFEWGLELTRELYMKILNLTYITGGNWKRRIYKLGLQNHDCWTCDKNDIFKFVDMSEKEKNIYVNEEALREKIYGNIVIVRDQQPALPFDFFISKQLTQEDNKKDKAKANQLNQMCYIYGFLVCDAQTFISNWPCSINYIPDDRDPSEYVVLKIGMTKTNIEERQKNLCQSIRNFIPDTCLEKVTSVSIPFKYAALLYSLESKIHSEMCDTKIKLPLDVDMEGKNELFFAKKVQIPEIKELMNNEGKKFVSKLCSSPVLKYIESLMFDDEFIVRVYHDEHKNKFISASDVLMALNLRKDKHNQYMIPVNYEGYGLGMALSPGSFIRLVSTKTNYKANKAIEYISERMFNTSSNQGNHTIETERESPNLRMLLESKNNQI